MSHAVGDLRRWCAFMLAMMALLSSTRVAAQTLSGNPRLWATPDRFQGLSGASFRPVDYRASGVRYALLAESNVQGSSGVWTVTDEMAPVVEELPVEEMPLQDSELGGEPGFPPTDVYPYGSTFDEPVDPFCVPAGGHCACGMASCHTCRGYDLRPGFDFLTLRFTTIGIGVVGFKNASNLGQDGSFGFHESLNYAAPIPLIPETGLGWQVGFRTLQADLSGANFTTEERNQTFFTTGLFRRVAFGLQGGIVFDLMRDVWYDDMTVSQVRGEVSWKCPARHEWGYWFAAGGSNDTTLSPIVAGQTLRWESTDLHAVFYRRRFACLPAAEGRFYVGFSDQADGLLGADANVPINSRWALRSTFTYLVPDEPTNAGGTQNEGWNLGIAGVWHFGGNAKESPTYYAPLFDVADNGSFVLD